MPVITMFATLNSARKQNREKEIFKFIELSNIAAISLGSVNYFEKLQDRYKGQLEKREFIVENETKTKSIRAESESALNSMAAFFGG